MPFNGAGMFTRLRNWVADAAAGVKIRADYHDIEDNGFADGLSQCIVRDGQSTITNNIPMNSKRLIALSDPTDPQDASTKAYADTKLSLAGGGTITGNVTIKKPDPVLRLDGVAGSGYGNALEGSVNGKMRWLLRLGNSNPETGGNAGSDFDVYRYADDGSLIAQAMSFSRASGLGTVAANPTTPLGIVTKQYADAINANANTKLPIAGGTITGNLVVNGTLGTVSNVLYFSSGASGSGAYLQWQGGGSYALGGGGIVWHNGNLAPVTSMRLVEAGNIAASNGGMQDAPAGAVLTGLGGTTVSSTLVANSAHCRYLQYLTPGGWFTAGLA